MVHIRDIFLLDIQLERNKKFFSREVSWLAFNHRVLQEATNANLPLIERLKFLGIFSSNQDEFFRVRVATLQKIVETEKDKKSAQLFGYKPQKLLQQIEEIARRSSEVFDQTFAEIKKSLKEEGIYLVDENELLPEDEYYVYDYFKQKISSLLIPVMLQQTPKFPDLKDQSIYLAVILKREGQKKDHYALLELPTKAVPRFIQIPSKGDKSFIIFLDDVIRACLPMIFSRFDYTSFRAYTLKVTRDSELGLDDDDFSESYVKKINDSLKRRRMGEPTRIVYDQEIPSSVLEYFLKELEFNSYDALIPGGRYHQLRDLFSFPDLGHKNLLHRPFNHVVHPAFLNEKSFFEVIKNVEVLLHFPYHSFDPVIDLLREAAIDPKVLSIEMTIYRLAKHSKIANALIIAAKNGKKVFVNLELQARFDEEANLKWANIMRDEGLKVSFGFQEIKVHSKMCLIRRKEGDEINAYAMLGTGNFNENTAKLYTDYLLMTSSKRLVKEVEQAFAILHMPYTRSSFRHLLVSPFNLRAKLIRLVENEMKRAANGGTAYLDLKVNNLADQEMIDLLYRASQCGVVIRLIVRGMCSLIPGVKGMSENIQVISIVDRFLEHSRVYLFGNGGKELCYLSSADWMTRNLNRRVELAFPVYNRVLKKQIRHSFDLQWKDNVRARIIDKDLKNEFQHDGNENFRSQYEIERYIRKLN